MSKHTLPFIVLYEEKDGDDVFYIAQTNIRETASPGETRLVGKYYLNSVQEVSMKVSRKNVQ